jgi:hypothetical protein
MSEPRPDARSPVAVRWLHASYRIGAVIDLVAAIGMTVPRLYGPTLRATGSFDRSRPEFGYALGTGAPLMWGWTGLLLWADRRPIERRFYPCLPVSSATTPALYSAVCSGVVVYSRSGRCRSPLPCCSASA